jgi:uncharacterized Zn finger protein
MEEAPESPDLAESTRVRPAGALHAADIYCEVCGRTTPHRILRLEGGTLPGVGGTVQGTARCKECRLIHPFRAEPSRRVTLQRIVSDGPRSTTSSVELPEGQVLRVGSNLPDTEPAQRILRLDTPAGRRVTEAAAVSLATVWVSASPGLWVPVSIVEGRRTHAARISAGRDQPFEIGTSLEVEGRRYVIAAMRADGTTWHDLGRTFPGRALQRLYVRRMATPPPGRSDWSSERETPRVRASSTSTRGRSRSSPGTTIVRSRPRARRASGGATDHRLSP